MRFCDEWIAGVTEVINRIRTTQGDNLQRAAEIISDSIRSSHVCFLFGCGHSIIPVIEMYPRYGGALGFMPILELPLSHFTRLVGDLGFPQYDFLEEAEGYGKCIMRNYDVHKEDSMVLFSNAGSSPLVVDVALSFKERGGKLICVTSLAHSTKARSRHSTGKKLYEVADVVIDNCTPEGDVIVAIPGQEEKVGPISTVGSIVVADLITLEVVGALLEKGQKILVSPVRGYDAKAEEKMKKILSEYAKRLRAHLGRV